MAEAETGTFRPSSYVARHGRGIRELDVPASA